MAESEGKSYGVIVNSFRELEPNYADFYRDELGRRNWAIGPVSLSNRRSEEKAGRGGRGTESKEPDSVIYICFGSLADFADSQLKEIAAALESWGGSFIWVVRKDPRTESESESEEEWLPVGFEDRTAEKGLIIRGWAPQILILDHEARKAKELREMARMAIEEGGSSHSSLSDLIDELKQRSHV
ncbi:unnamed protein product [Linum tenue]|uniref:Uncharacterized protein n=1 Tax=Linum tenue TaxID=586396 RepID=A0AAV0RIE6_9ROSI|nr:unnamed protein product [Linum tenue]